jgi:asparagine synthase (glutamine-hydrolysing)
MSDRRDLHLALTQQIATRTDLTRVYSNTHLIVFANQADIVMPLGAQGCIIGRLFARTSRLDRLQTFKDGQIEAVVGTAGAHLLEAFWGNYVAFLSKGEQDAIVLRDPSGAMPAYETRYFGAPLFSSDMQTLRHAGLLTAYIDWSFLPQHLFDGGLRTSNTALKDVKELLPGARLTYRAGQRHEDACWSPWDHIAPTEELDDKALAERVRDTVRYSTNALASCFGRPLTGVSGGLDSSIIAASLAETSRSTAALTLATDEPEGDERRYARQVTDALALHLFEHIHDPEGVNLHRSVSQHLPRPMGNFMVQSVDAARAFVGTTYPFDAYFSGRGGDNVFCYLQSASALLDRVAAEGLSKGAWQTLYDICRMTESSAWDVASLAVKRALSGGPTYVWRGQAGFLHPDVVPQTPSRHTWLEPPRGTPFGKAVHVMLLVRIQGTLEGFSPYDPAELVTPLLSQPLVELCLQVPSWRWCAGGRNRAPVRRAFSNVLPKSIVNRTTKGGPDSFCIEVLERNRAEVKGLLLEGQLTAHGLLNRVALEQILTASAPLVPPQHLQIATLLEVEAWINAWQRA